MSVRHAWIAGAVTALVLGAVTTPALGAGDVCVSIKGDDKKQMGTSACASTGTSKAIAINDSVALAEGGNNNTVTVINGEAK
jgi:hypothetical protein